MNWELIIQVSTLLLVSSPGIYAIARQLKTEKIEKKKLILEAESIGADVAAKLIDSAGDLQELYTKLFEELKKQLEGQKMIVCRLEVKVDILVIENKELKEIAEKQNKKIEELGIGIETLTQQIRELGQEPRYPKE